MKQKSLSEFFNTDFVNFASYDNLRKIASLMDGQKNGARKVLYTVLEKNVKDKLKVSQLGAKTAEFAEYLHGSLDGVIVNLAQDFPGSNNVPLLQKKGNFGTRFVQSASASRYIYAYGSKEFFELFKKEDVPILRHQSFEGNPIEPMFYVPSLPVLLLNGSEGVSSGYAQKILSRSPEDVKKYILSRLSSKPTPKLMPWFKGFSGTVHQGENDAQFLIKGSVKVTGINKVEITELPIGYDLKGYVKVLDDLEEKKIIQGYKDLSEDDSFKFIVTVPSKSLKEWDHETLLSRLKLVKTVTENYTVMNEENRVQVFDDVYGIVDRYIEIKLQYLEKRKNYLVQKLEEDIRYDFSRYLFIKMIVDEELPINKRKKEAVTADLDKVDNILQRDGSYDYLLNMAIMTLTEERMQKLEADIKKKKADLDVLARKSVSDLWREDL